MMYWCKLHQHVDDWLPILQTLYWCVKSVTIQTYTDLKHEIINWHQQPFKSYVVMH